jgi:sigma-B regulation protein RsbU (phosphoserine phosphatase)
MNEDLISRVPLLASLPRSEIEYLARTLRQREFPEDALLFYEGTTDDSFYILLDGRVDILKALGSDAERLLGVREPGSFIGEMSLFSRDGRRTASVRARTPLRVLEMTRADFDALLSRQPTLAYDMVRVLSKRLLESEDRTIRDLEEKNRQLAQAYEDLKAAQAQIIEKEKLEHELLVASRIQMSILPHKLPELAGFDFGARIVPMSAVGGDFYDFIPLDSDTLGIAVGDVSGHGVPAALFMALTVTLLRAEACHDCSPQQVLRGVNRQLLNMNEEGMFVTVLYGVLHRAAGEFTYVRAGHELPLLCRADGALIKPALERGQILGLFDNPHLPEQAVTLTPHSTLLLYTDGVTEAVGEQGEMFEEERLRQAVDAYRDAPAQVMCERILERVMRHIRSVAQRDDITLLSVQAG